jgi:hypothetical protein
MSYFHLHGKTLFFDGVANIHEEKRPPVGPTICHTERFGRLHVDQSGKAVRFEPIDTDSGWWIGFKPGEPEKFKENNERREFTYRGQQVVPDFFFY